MHVFSDASELAYGAVIYLRLSSTPPKLAFVTGKSRVAPKKTVSIPRLELNAAAIACKLADSVKTNLRIKPVSTTFWTDSMAVLRFINNTKSRFKVFVANRLSIIHEFTTPSQWQYVKTEENPADLASRGVSPDDLKRLQFWLDGPDFLLHSNITYVPPSDTNEDDVTEQEAAETKIVAATVNPPTSPAVLLIERWSNYIKLLRCTAYLKRVTTPGYITSVRAGTKSNPLSIAELNAAELTLIKRVQEQEFFDEIDRLNTQKALKSSSRIIQLNPFLDEQGTLRVGGRIKNSEIPQNTKHPIILPPGRLTQLLITKIHTENAHAGATFTLAALRQKYWPLHAVSLVKRVTRNCVSCRQRNANPCTQKMADLPAARVQAHNPPFTNTGID